MGLVQLTPGTAAQLGVTEPYDPGANIADGTAYLRGLLDRFGGNVELALAAYNAGPTAVGRFGLQVLPFRETQDYVDKVGRVTGSGPGPAAAPRAGKSSAKATGTPAPKALIYRVVDLVDGRPVARYTTERPRTGTYKVIPP